MKFTNWSWTSLTLCSVLALATADKIASTNGTVDTEKLKTWWHDEGEINTNTPVKEANVRQSHRYAVWAKSTSDSTDTYYNSFVYETVPRNGQGNIITPGDPSSTTTADDGVTIEPTVGITMGWSQFLYSADTWVKVSRRGNNPSTAKNVVIRPTNLGLQVRDDGNGSVYILVPYRSQGYRFSVEFQDNLHNYQDSCATTTCDFVQDLQADSSNYVADLNTKKNPIMGTEPQDALLIFASAFPTDDLVPSKTASTTYVVQPGSVPDLGSITNKAVYFMPGVHYMSGTSHATLASSVDWVYLAPGAFVKGAFQFTSSASVIKATGFGVVSGEQYVYQANTANGYTNSKSNDAGLRIWSGKSASGKQQTFVLTGLTTNSPPFNSIDFKGDLDTISINQWDYKMVGGYFGQTDGTTLYKGSNVRDTFYHSSDDTIKTYGSNIKVSDVIVWKGKTAPVIQFGWASRNLANITVTEIDVIHMRYTSNGSHPSIIGANQVYDSSETQTDTADLSNWITDIYFGGIRTEGVSGNLMRICPLSNYKNITIENVSLDSFSVKTNGIYESELQVFTDSSGKAVSIDNFVISNFTVGGEKVTQSAKNYGPSDLGGLNIASEFLSSGSVVIQ